MEPVDASPSSRAADGLQLLAALAAFGVLIALVVGSPFGDGAPASRMASPSSATAPATALDQAAPPSTEPRTAVTVAGIAAVGAPPVPAEAVRADAAPLRPADQPVVLAGEPSLVYTPGVAPPPVEAVVPSRTRIAEVAVPQIAVRREPAGVVTHRFGDRTQLDQPRVFLVFEERDGWLHVSLPVRPNGTTGWVSAADVRLGETSAAVAVDLDGRRLTLFDAALPTFSTWVTVGASATPTPDGLTYVSDLAATTEPFYGPYVLGLSGFSEVLTEFRGGPGQLGIHGTSEPELMGSAASHGCVRVTNDVMTYLAEVVPLGTPVYLL